MITGININQKVPFEIDGTTFVLKPLKQKDKMLIGQGMDVLQKNQDVVMILERMNSALMKTIAEIQNIIIDGETKTLKEINEDVLEILPIEIKQEVFQKVLELNTPQVKEIKN